MHKLRFTLMMMVLILAIMLPACTQTPVSEPPAEDQTLIEEPAEETQEVTEPAEDDTQEVVEPPVEEPEIEEEIQSDEDERLQALISEKIGGCHMLNFILSQNKTREEWSTTIDRMIGKGAQVNAEEKELIIDWLVSRNQ